MALVPLNYNLRSLAVRKSSTLLTMLSIGATVAVLSAVLALEAGFLTMFTEQGREDLAVVLRSGAASEGESGLLRRDIDQLVKGSSEFAVDDDGQPLASAETFLAIRLRKMDGGETNIAIRGVQPATFKIHAETLRFVEGRALAPGKDEIVVGRGLVNRIPNCEIGETLKLNLTPFRIVGIFEGPGAFESEIWGDAERMLDALERPVFNRVIGKLADGVTAADLNARLQDDKRIAAKALTEREYLTNQTGFLTGLFSILGTFLTIIMGIAAVFTGLNAMYSSIASRTREIGILLSTGFRPFSIFLAFLFEAGLVGLLGGILGVLLVIPLNGIQTGTSNFSTFTEVAFELRVTAEVALKAVLVAVILGVLGGAFPAWKAARMEITTALRRR